MLNIRKRLFSCFGNTVRVDRDLKQRRRRRQRELQRSKKFRLGKKNKSARASRFFVHCFNLKQCRFVVTARLRRENFFLWRTWIMDNDFLFLFLNFDTVFYNSAPEKKNCQHLTNWTRWNNHDRFSGARRHFLSVVFVVIIFVFA